MGSFGNFLFGGTMRLFRRVRRRVVGSKFSFAFMAPFALLLVMVITQDSIGDNAVSRAAKSPSFAPG
jgi:hypothetical protein